MITSQQNPRLNFLKTSRLGYIGISFGSLLFSVINFGIEEGNVFQIRWFFLFPAILLILGALSNFHERKLWETSFFL
ncbi:hypothetical protein M0811_07644 [Anaeramoeba ignava]|uniref:Uncharacterized protein n=1 Tax=Anaeramoeba ignava TaxID=1746090 RepID=A0A9Q0LNC1_ANAIG|nr:hypothetical protein M0811_07644 [Anaeramoeba ignava]